MKSALLILLGVVTVLFLAAQNMNPSATPYYSELERQRVDNRPHHEFPGKGVTRFEFLDGSALEITDRGALPPGIETILPGVGE